MATESPFAGNIHPELSHAIIGCAMRVHSTLGPGLLEGIYEECLCSEMTDRGIHHRRQVAIPLRYAGKRLRGNLRVDVIVDDKMILEIKAIDQVLPVHEAQLLTYLRLTGLPLGLLINFNVPHLRDGIRRRVLTGRSPIPEASPPP